MIGITGDVHGDITRFKHKNIRKLRKNDILFICGDFGFIWDGTKKEQRILKRLGKKRYTIIFVDGCHENFELLNQYPEGEFSGGKVRNISGRLMYAKRGSIFNLNGIKVLTFGGGQSTDIDIRSACNKWWEEELPLGIEVAEGADNLQANDNSVDYIVTHEPPASMRNTLGFDSKQTSEMHSFFDSIMENCNFKMWFFGKTHKNKLIPPRYNSIFNDCILIKEHSRKIKK